MPTWRLTSGQIVLGAGGRITGQCQGIRTRFPATVVERTDHEGPADVSVDEVHHYLLTHARQELAANARTGEALGDTQPSTFRPAIGGEAKPHTDAPCAVHVQRCAVVAAQHGGQLWSRRGGTIIRVLQPTSPPLLKRDGLEPVCVPQCLRACCWHGIGQRAGRQVLL